ncbi:hypothetical protein [Streptomyces palmae]|uniref:Uncharacterized protein n=1 Tax=Streptomyces palmae TaxID=1701085 RepID=A0A4Z0HD20_9ACTN|nr:hypothetical protein [Streptomyces palmae]TGB09214.1 hypothetical protein E4099_14075 [Streptomyces palmae]
MSGRGDPPEGTPEGAPGGNDDEYRSVVFDESFVRAARLQEFSAQERIGEHTPAVRSRRSMGRYSPSKQALVLVTLIVLAFATAVYMGIRHPYQPPGQDGSEPMRSTVVPLAPRDPVPGGAPADLLAHSPAADFRTDADGVTLPGAHRTQSFSANQVMSALLTVKDYIVESSIDRAVVSGGASQPVRLLLDPGQQDQFESSLSHPANDGQHAATGWLTRFDPSRVVLTDEPVRVHGTLAATELNPGTLEITADHSFVYTVRPADSPGTAKASLFTVHREARFHLNLADLRDHQVQLVYSAVQAGPQSCGADTAGYLQPLLAGQRAKGGGPAVTDPYRLGQPTAGLCGVLAPGAQPSLPAGH